MRYLLVFIFSLTLLQFINAQDEVNTEVLELISELNTAKYDTSKVNLLNKLAAKFIGDDNDKALEYSKRAQILSQKINFGKGLSNAYYNIAKCFYYQYEFDSIIYYYGLSKKNTGTEIDIEVAAKFESLMGLVKHIQSNYTEAIKYYNESLKLHKKQNNIKGMARSYNNLGAAYYDLVNYEKALDNYFKSLQINEEIDNSFMVAKTLANIGGVYEDQEKYGSALEYYKKAILIATKADSKQTIADTYLNIGGIYTQQCKFDSTQIVYDKALEIYQALGDLRGMVNVYNLFGDNYVLQTDNVEDDSKSKLFEKALKYYNKSLDINNRDIDNIGERIVSYQGMAVVFINQKKFLKAIPYLIKAKKMAEEISSLMYIKSIHENLSKAYAGLGNYKLAYKNHVLFKNWNDSLKNDENIELLTQTSMQYEFDKQQKEQEFLQAQKDLEYQQKQKRDRLVRIFILIGLAIVSVFSVQMFMSYKRKIKDNILLEEQNEEIEKQKEEITDSIIYAKRIQTAILPSNNWANENLPEHFIMFRPRDIVSGDYYWMNKIDNKVIVVAADCTGHGVPGAFMSMLGVSFLNEIVNKNNIVQPNLILNQLRNQVKRTLDQTGKDGEAKDGMDIAICVIDFDEMKLQYAGAYNPLYLYRKGELIETKADKMPIGIYIREKESFTNHEIDLEKGDTFYIFSDGFADQFGGPKGGKFKSRPFKNLLASIQPHSMIEQWEILESTIDDWRGDIDQIDDIIILGVRV